MRGEYGLGVCGFWFGAHCLRAGVGVQKISACIYIYI